MRSCERLVCTYVACFVRVPSILQPELSTPYEDFFCNGRGQIQFAAYYVNFFKGTFGRNIVQGGKGDLTNNAHQHLGKIR